MSGSDRKRNSYPTPPPKPRRTFASKRTLDLTGEECQTSDEYDTLWPSNCEPVLQKITQMKVEEPDTSHTGGTCRGDDQKRGNKNKEVGCLRPSVRDKISQFENQRSDTKPRFTQAQTTSKFKSVLSSDDGEREMSVKRPIPKPRVFKTKSNETEKKDIKEDVYTEIDDERTDIKREYQYVAAIDVGTAYSGYAFSSREHFDRNPIDIISPNWNDGTFLSLKTSTCVLYNAHGQLDSFGFEADNKYYEMSMNDPDVLEHWLKFTHFKMKLYDAKGPLEHMMLEADEGGSMPALIIFSDVIRYLKRSIIEHIRQLKSDVIDDDVRWVVTVPAIWNDEARKFMIKASVKAGIHADDLFLCLEPEAAAVMCKELKVQNYIDTKSDGVMAFMLGSKFVVVDLGGGTVDITTNEVLPNGMIRELKCCRGSDCGGTYVNKRFREFIEGIVHKDFELLNKTYRTEMNDLWRSFEIKKRQVDPQKSQYVMLQIPSIIAQKIIPEKLSKFSITLVRDKLKFPMEIFQTFFASSVSIILSCLREVVTDDINSILLVGGYAGCKEIQCIVRKTYPKQRLVCPHDPDLVVVKGAVIFGHNPAVISSRISKLWYGIQIQPEFTPIETLNEGNFYPVIKKGQPIKIGDKLQHKFYITDSFEGDVINVKQVSFSGDEMPVNVEDARGVESEHSLRVPVPVYQGNMKRILRIIVKFKGTELEYSSFVTLILCPTKNVIQVK